MKQKRDDAYFDKIWCQTCEKASESGIELPSDERTNRRVSRPPAVLAAYVTDRGVFRGGPRGPPPPNRPSPIAQEIFAVFK